MKEPVAGPDGGEKGVDMAAPPRVSANAWKLSIEEAHEFGGGSAELVLEDSLHGSVSYYYRFKAHVPQVG